MKKAVAKKKPAPVVEVEEEPVPEQYGARPSKATICAFCEHLYIKPCTVKTKDKCLNYQHLQSRSKKK